jgi:putative ATPase
VAILGVAYNQRVDKPLAARLRPTSIDEVLGQPKLMAPGSALQRLISQDRSVGLSSIILWGPPGSGKTTLARLISTSKDAEFVELSAISTSVAQVREVIEQAKRNRELYDRPTILFLDEIHRFSKSQQDSLLGAVESGMLTLIAATTENPAFSIIRPLISRSLVQQLEPLDASDIRVLLQRALDSDLGLPGRKASAEALEYISKLCSGDARRALTLLEATAAMTTGEISAADVEAASANPVPYDATGDQHYDTISAFIKSVRGSDADAAIHYLARMLAGGEDPRFIARRIMILAAEDIGLADPQALPLAVAAAQTVELIGMPEARIPLAEATIYLALAPKSNRAYNAINAAMAEIESSGTAPVPAPLRSTGAVGYRYPHDDPRGVLKQEYWTGSSRYYQPSAHGFEKLLADRLKVIDEILGK